MLNVSTSENIPFGDHQIISMMGGAMCPPTLRKDQSHKVICFSAVNIFTVVERRTWLMRE